jgi:transposase
MPKYRKFTQEYRDEAVLMVIQSQRPIAQVARELGINEGTLGTWLSKYRSEHSL